MRIGKVRIKFQRPLKPSGGFIEFKLAFEDLAKVVLKLGPNRIQLKCSPAAIRRW
jgi:hypothetical protein